MAIDFKATSRDLNHLKWDEYKESRGRISMEGQGLLEDDSSVGEISVEMNEDRGTEMVLLAQQNVLSKQQQQPSTPMVRWELFLPVRTIKVLLVESDDSTRHIVSALLRNCGYEVTAVAYGLEAWKCLEDLTNHIDLILIEVVIPYLSGLDLLTKVMGHKTCNNIPTIMMSSNDSVGIVFECLSNGAVDFLVKPVRKNELKNLWQHVWRRRHNSSGSGIVNQTSANSKRRNGSYKTCGSNDKDNGNVGLNAIDSSDNGSGAQSSWTMHDNVHDNGDDLPQPMPSLEQVEGPQSKPDALAIHLTPESFFGKKAEVNMSTVLKECNKLSDEFMGKDLEIGQPRNVDPTNESYQTEKTSTKLISPSIEKLLENQKNNDNTAKPENGGNCNDQNTKTADLIAGITTNIKPQPVLGLPGTSKTFSTASEMNGKLQEGCMELPSLELSLKRLRPTGGVALWSDDESRALKHSNLSAFSRYRTSAPSIQDPSGHGISSVFGNSSMEFPLKQGSNGSSTTNDMGSTNNCTVNKPEISAINCNHPSSAFHSVTHQNCSPQQIAKEKVGDANTVPLVVGDLWGTQKKVQVQHRYDHYHHDHHHIHAKQNSMDHDDSTHKNLKTAASYCSSTTVRTGAIDANGTSFSLDGSKHGSNDQNGCNACLSTEGMNMDSNACVAKKGGDEASHHNHFAQREAVLNKFRQKRKARNFSKKVRYQSRKRLAEQRPRIRGQFVRRANVDNKSRRQKADIQPLDISGRS